uniref:Predicted protein n=1 Tax=Physcomitrium patens TaxID=3218 RepID=A9U1B6_PHYPA
MQQQQSNDRKEALVTKALQAVVNKIDQFNGRNISRYLRCYVREMELNRVSEKKIVALFELATIPEIRDHITSITDHYGNSWEVFSHALKDEYFLEDVDRITKKLFLEWIERPNKNLQATELLREFERQFSQLSKVEKLTLEPNKVDLFLQAADGELQGKLELLLEDKEEDEGLTTKWKNVEDAVGLLTKRERRKDRSNIPKTVQAPKAPVRTTPPTMPIVQPSTSLSKKADMGMEEIIRGMRDLKSNLKRILLQTIQRMFQNKDMYKDAFDDDVGGSTKTSEFWTSTISTMQEGKLPREVLLRTAATIRGATGWEDPIESLSVHAYIAKSQHEALMEEKRRGNFDDTREGNSSKRQTRGDKAWEAASQELLIKDTSASLGEKTKETKDKGKSIAYKLLFDIEAATNLKGVLEERILNAKVEFTLKEVLEIAKKEFHDVIIDSIKRKRIYKDEEEVDIGYKQPTNEKNGYNQRVCFEDSSNKEMETLSHYTRKHSARATTEVLVKEGDIEEPIVALVDHGSEINLISKNLYKKQKWRIDMEYGWTIRAANNTRGELYGACPHVKIRIGDVATEQHFFVQDTTSYPLILGKPYITTTRMETKVLDDGSAYARVHIEDETKAVLFLIVPPNDEWNRDRLREKPLPKIVEGFKDFGEEVLFRDEGAFDASFIGISENKKVNDFKRKERKRLYDIKGQLCKLGTLQDDKRILGVYEENGLEDSLELITSIGLRDNDKIVEIQSREVYTKLESFQAPEVTVETRYKTADKKVKPVAAPLPQDSKEQMGEASKEASLRDPISIGHQFTKETFEELKIGSDGSLLPEEITCFKKMLAKQGRSFAFESHEIGCVDPNILTPMVIFTVPHVPWNLRPIPVPRSNYANIQVTMGPLTQFEICIGRATQCSLITEKSRFLKIKGIGEELHASCRRRKDGELDFSSSFGKTEAIVAEHLEIYQQGQKGLRQAVEGHLYRFTIYSCSRLYSSSQKLIDCLTIGESPYYLLQPDVRRVLKQESTVDDDLGGSTKTSEFWASAISTMQEGKLPREALLRTAATIRGATGSEDPVESLSVHAYITKSQHEALMEEKRRGNFDDTREENSSKRQTRGDKAREGASQELPLKDTSASLEEKMRETKDKSKSIAYKLLFDIEAATNLKGVLEECILNAKVEFTLKEVLGITKKEFHDVIIDSIKRKRQLMGETGMSHAIDARIYKDEEEVDIGYKQRTNEKNGYNQRVRFEDYSDKEMETLSHYTRKHWARATT